MLYMVGKDFEADTEKLNFDPCDLTDHVTFDLEMT